jgi:aryl-alcohol dehydrogenase-like predicted oxidoreductase
LSGKYRREGGDWHGEGRFEQFRKSGNPLLRQLTERHWKVLDTTLNVGKKLGKTPAQIALNWVVTQAGVTSTILGTTKLAQLEDNLGAIEFAIPAPLRDEASAIEPGTPYTFFGPMLQSRISGGTALHSWVPAKIYPDLKAAPPAAEVAKANAAEK